MEDQRIRKILIVGGGTAGWMAAAATSRFLEGLGASITLVESEEIGTVGVGEATIPPIMEFIHVLGINEDEIIREIRATFKLGIGYQDWTRPGHFYFHPFGPTGFGMGPVSFNAYWMKMFLAGKAARLEDYSIMSKAAEMGKFMRPVHAPNTPFNKITYALHFDASLFARFLRKWSEARGVKRINAKVDSVALRPEDGFVKSVTLNTGEEIEADLFIDCSGFRGLVIEQALKTGYEDWTHLLFCDRAMAVPSESAGPPASYTLSTAREAGWQWRIPLQHRTGNGHVYCSSFISDDKARDILMANLPGKPLAEPLALKFTAGRRRKGWNKNCVALGLASGFLEPLESTAIHMVHRGLALLFKFFPDRTFQQADIDRYNKMIEFEVCRVRDFILMHYIHTERPGEFWEHCRRVPPTDSLKEKLELFKSYGRILREDTELFPVQSWLFVMIGQNIIPRGYDPLADTLMPDKIMANLDDIRDVIRRCVEAMPPHGEFIAKTCAAKL